MNDHNSYPDQVESNSVPSEEGNRLSETSQPVASSKESLGSAISSGLLPLRIIGSLAVGIIIASILMIIFAWGTFVESEYGRRVANFALYESRWFAALLGLLALNIFCSMLSRLPWRRHHLPFLLAHAGILILLAGSYLSWRFGEEAQITLPEGSATSQAIKMDRQHFELQDINFQSSRGQESKAEIPFEPGPFNWEDYARENWVGKDSNQNSEQNFDSNSQQHSNSTVKKGKSKRRRFQDTLWFAMQWGNRQHGNLKIPDAVSSELKNAKLEVLDYLAASDMQVVPPIELSVLWTKRSIRTRTDLGNEREMQRSWERARMAIRPMNHHRSLEIRGTSVEQVGGERICFFVTTSMAEVEAFQTNINADIVSATGTDRDKVDGNADTDIWGLVTLFVGSRNYSLKVDHLLKGATGERRLPIPGTVLEIGNVRLQPRGPSLGLTLYAPNGMQERLALAPLAPESSVQANVLGVYGTYQINPETLKKVEPENIAGTSLELLGKPRLELLQGPDKRLYYRYWNGERFAYVGVFPSVKEAAIQSGKAGAKPSLVLSEGNDDEVRLTIDRFYPHDFPGIRIVPKPIGREQGTSQLARLRLTVDGKEDVFWLRPVFPSIVPFPLERDQVRYVHGNGRSIRVTWDFDRIPLGFGVFLKQFEKRTEPGTRMSSHYSSLVDFIATPMHEPTRAGEDEQTFWRDVDRFVPLRKDVLIKMNQPAVFQGTGHRYRIYQSSYNGPYHPGDPYFHMVYSGDIFSWETKPRDTIYLSTLSVNYDPGRGLKYLGSFLLIVGIGWFFFKRR